MCVCLFVFFFFGVCVYVKNLQQMVEAGQIPDNEVAIRYLILEEQEKHILTVS